MVKLLRLNLLKLNLPKLKLIKLKLLQLHEGIWFAVWSGTMGKSDIPFPEPKFCMVSCNIKYIYIYICTNVYQEGPLGPGP